MTVNISHDFLTVYRDIEMEGSTLIFDKFPQDLKTPGVVIVWGEGYHKTYNYPVIFSVPSKDGKVRVKLSVPMPDSERLDNLEEAITELYETVTGG